jgi:hypothetical protein
MFTAKELNKIDRHYFNVIQAGCYCVTLQSKNTQHYWHITHLEYPAFTSCQIEHKHNYSDSYHQHGHSKTLAQALQSIKAHDAFQLNGRRAHRKPAGSKSTK